MRNPFNPNFGRVPKIYLGREALVRKLLSELEYQDSRYLTTLIYGMRGVGKTALMTEVGQTLAKRKDWLVVDMTSANQLVPTLLELVYQQADRGLREAFHEIDGVKISAYGLQFAYQRKTGPAPTANLALLKSMADQLQRRHLKLLITIDEVVSSPDLREFVANYQLLLRGGAHIALMLAGLPGNVSELWDDKLLTFLLRSPRLELMPLDPLSVKQSYQTTFAAARRAIAPTALAQMVKATQGYAYAFQLLGYHVWETGAPTIDEATLASVLPQYQTELFRDAYGKIYEELSAQDQAYLQAMAQETQPEVATRIVQRRLQKPKNYLSVYRQRLLAAQVIQAPRRGYVKFSLPFFREFVLARQEFEY